MMMIGSKQRICIGGWLLAAIVLAWVNAYPLMSMEDQPLTGYSHTIKSLQGKLHQFDSNLAGGLYTPNRQASRPVKRPALAPKPIRSVKAEGKPLAESVRTDVQNQAPSLTLPSLAGIMQVVGLNGSAYFQAVLNGKACRAKDKVDGFTIVKITSAGVVIQRSGRRWTLDSPTPYYSSDHGN